MRDWQPALSALPNGFGPWARSIGLELTAARADLLQAKWQGSPGLYQPFGLVNGGVHCTVTETLASLAAALHRLDGTLPHEAPVPALADLSGFPPVVGVSNLTEFFRPLRTEKVTSTATPVHTGRTQQVWQVETVDEQDRLVARGQLRLQNL